jgi:putative phosphoesterase
MTRIGLISDTHGLLRPEALEALRGCTHIVHGGDIGNAGILEQLAALAPVTAVRGNNDTGDWADAVRETELIEVAGLRLYALHDLNELALDPEAAGIGVVVSGHSHRPRIEQRGAVLFVNPGSAGPRRFSLPVTVAELLVEGDSVSARVIDLAITPVKAKR